ncbi:MAG: D-tyrosyl-tRNA(Tyr) deacylase [Gammaproteobacteria bacterium]|nr:D-tyrosyl-tRNA(Tyr) deacylase [Gammaproteobacteria bacterium]
MIALLQRVKKASVSVAGRQVARIGPGLLVLVGIERGDGPVQASRLAERLFAYRIFADAEDRMNLSLKDTGGEMLLVPQFTLVADTSRGNRPGFERAASPELAAALFRELVASARLLGCPTQTGEFGANMDIELVNTGPASFLLHVPQA